MPIFYLVTWHQQFFVRLNIKSFSSPSWLTVWFPKILWHHQAWTAALTAGTADFETAGTQQSQLLTTQSLCALFHIPQVPYIGRQQPERHRHKIQHNKTKKILISGIENQIRKADIPVLFLHKLFLLPNSVHFKKTVA